MATEIQGLLTQKVQTIDEARLTQRIAYTSTTPQLAEYVGEALPGTASSAAGWRIRKLTYSGTNVTKTEWAGGNTRFDNVWDDRAGDSYS